MRQYLILVFCVFILSSCNKKIDASSDEALKSSIEEVKNSLDEEKKQQFEESLTLIMMQEFDLRDIMQGKDPEATVAGMKEIVDGKTADDIIAEAGKIKDEIERKKKEQAKLEIAELFNLQDEAEKHKKELGKFEVSRSRFYIRKSGTYYITETPLLDITVKNGTSHPISRAYFSGTLASPNRSVPWHKEDFNYSIPGGLEPGEEAHWVLEPSFMSDWGDVDAPNDAILTVDVLGLDDANGETLYTVNNFGEDEQNRLTELLDSYPEFNRK